MTHFCFTPSRIHPKGSGRAKSIAFSGAVRDTDFVNTTLEVRRKRLYSIDFGVSLIENAPDSIGVAANVTLTRRTWPRDAQRMLTSGTVLACGSGRAIVRFDNQLVAVELSGSAIKGDRLRGDFSRRRKTSAINVTRGTVCEIDIQRVGVAPDWAKKFLQWTV